MGKKVKIGKQRKDKYYQLAKETGYRARSAFKLLQLNRKFNFLESARVCVDLCAAPGGWLQVAQQHMPMSSHIIGVDLVPIKPIRNVVTLQEDITTEKCRVAIRKEIHTWQVDVVLHDGAPNVGKNWLHDAFSQAQLTLQALKLGIGILKKGGWFVTKIFRSKDYNALLWVFRQLFKKVFATKPKASRSESAEIFVVCQYFVKPDKIDPKFTDPKFVFKDVMGDEGTPINLMHPEKRNKKTDGYVDDDFTQYHRLSVLDFLASSNHLEKLANASEIVLDDPRVAAHPLTTVEIKECCADIKVLGKREIRIVLNWRKKLKELIKSKTGGKASISDDSSDEDDEKDANETVNKVDDEEAGISEGEEEENDIDEQLKVLREDEAKENKKKLKKVRREKAKLQKKLDLKMVLPGDHIDVSVDSDLFKLKLIQNKQQLAAVEEVDLDELDDELSSDDETTSVDRKTREAYDRNEAHDYGFSSGDEDDDAKSDDWSDAEEKQRDEQEKVINTNPRLVNLENEEEKAQRNTNFWFKKDTFDLVNDDDDEDIEIDQTVRQFKEKGGSVIERPKQKGVDKKSGRKESALNGAEENKVDTPRLETVKDHLDREDDNSSESDSYDDDESESEEIESDLDERRLGKKQKTQPKGPKDGFEVVPANHPLKRRMDAEGLAIGAALAESRKRRRQVMESAYNRYTFDDQAQSLPDWFTKDESRHYFAQLPVTKEEVAIYKQREMEINARPIKKIAEAKGRKKRKMNKRLEKARKKAEAISENVDVTDKEKMAQMKNIYKRAGLLKKQQKKAEVTYVVAKKGVGKRVSRPAGVKGRFKVVDPRMKKEARKNKEIANRKGGKGKGKGSKRR